MTQSHIVPYFRDAFRPVMKGDTFISRQAFKAVEFKVVEVSPGNFGTVTDKTMVFTEGEPINRDEDEANDGIGYDDVGGCRKQMM